MKRRDALVAGGTAMASAVAGCSALMGPKSMAAEVTADTERGITWQYPPTQGKQDGIGYVTVQRRPLSPFSENDTTLHYLVNTTVAGENAPDPYTGYQQERFELFVRPPTNYAQRPNGSVSLYVRPQGSWEHFRTFSESRRGVDGLHVVIENIDTSGTIEFSLLLHVSEQPTPASLHCSFVVRASRGGLLKKTVEVEDNGQAPTTPAEKL